MARKRKRTGASDRTSVSSTPKKRIKLDEHNLPNPKLNRHPTLALYFGQTLTLRDFLLSRLPKSSKARRRRIDSIEKSSQAQSDWERPSRCNNGGLAKWRDKGDTSDLANLLNRTRVCMVDASPVGSHESRAKDFEIFSQQVSVTARSSIGHEMGSQVDLVDFAIWILFNKTHRHVHKPSHLLCQGYQRANAPMQPNEDQCAVAGIPGVVSHYPNGNVTTLKSRDWAHVLDLLGKEGDQIMLDLLLECSVFVALDGGKENYYQLSGTPLTDIKTRTVLKAIDAQRNLSLLEGAPKLQRTSTISALPTPKPPASITFVRNRMFYARAALNPKGKVTFGLRHIHALNRYPDANNKCQTVHLMKYIFPRQFGLHNAFTSEVDPNETVQPFKDYTLREQEISRKFLNKRATCGRVPQPQVPKRLRGGPLKLVQQLQRLHGRCSYTELLSHYCPTGISNSRCRSRVSWDRKFQIAGCSEKPPAEQLDVVTSDFVTQVSGPGSSLDNHSSNQQPAPSAPGTSLVELATPNAEVSAFCRASLSHVIPNGFWGEGASGKKNREIFMNSVDRFIRLRRFESLSLHVVCQGHKLGAMTWLSGPQSNLSTRMAHSDLQKRREIFLEFLYYVFDSLLIPLIRSNFHVTESNAHQNRLFYFRHDVWRTMTEPAITNIKLAMFEDIKTPKAKKLLDARTLGFSQIRLLPKVNGLRPITNLRRRVTKLQNGKVALCKSINSVMTPVFNALDFEKRRQPGLIGSALFSVGDMYPKLRAFATKLGCGNASNRTLYFAKADAKSCFDTIPQRKVVKLMEQITSENVYRLARHSEIKCTRTYHYRHADDVEMSKPTRKFITTAKAAIDFTTFDEFVDSGRADDKKNTIFVETMVPTSQKRERLLDLLEEHVQMNLLKVGKKFYRQKAGIPQGSVLSSLLCNYFYAQLEKEYFAFLEADESLLLRLIDDFLLITTNKDHAKRLLQTMHDGVEEYGVEVNPAKSLANFDVEINGHQVPRSMDGLKFPYCGNLIDTRALAITKDRDRRKGTVLADTLTVEPSRLPGRTFYRKALNAFKIQTHKMFLDTSFNSLNTVLSTIHQNFVETAMKYYRYVKSMTINKKPPVALLIGTIRDLIDFAFVLVKAKHKGRSHEDHCAVSKRQIEWLASKAFRDVLGKKQSLFGGVLTWLDEAIEQSSPGNRWELGKLERIVNEGNAVFKGYRY